MRLRQNASPAIKRRFAERVDEATGQRRLDIARGLDAAHQKGICVQPFPSGAGGWQVSLSGAGARWSAADPDGSVPGITVVQNWFAEFVKKR